MKSIILLLIASLIWSGCWSSGYPKNSKEAAEKREILKGPLAGPPEPDYNGKILYIYLRVDDEIKTGVAVNEENKRILVKLNERLLAVPDNKPVFLYGKVNQGRWEEHVTGIDFIVEMVGVYVPVRQGYVITLTGYGNRLLDNISYKVFMKTIVKEGFKVIK